MMKYKKMRQLVDSDIDVNGRPYAICPISEECSLNKTEKGCGKCKIAKILTKLMKLEESACHEPR